jgi:hypothetical protein
MAGARAAIAAAYGRPDVAGLCVADAFGVKVTVQRGALEVAAASAPAGAPAAMTGPPAVKRTVAFALMARNGQESFAGRVYIVVGG